MTVVYYPKLVVMNTILSLYISGYHRYHLLYVDLYTVLYIGYLVRCVGQRCGTFPYCILVLITYVVDIESLNKPRNKLLLKLNMTAVFKMFNCGDTRGLWTYVLHVV